VLFAVPSGKTSGYGTSLWSADVDARQLRHIRTHESLSPEFTLAPDGRGVYFMALATKTIWWLPLTASGDSPGDPQPTGLPALGTTIAHLTISSDGRRVAWTALDSNSHVWAADIGRIDRRASRGAVALTEGIGMRYSLPAPSSDGRLALVGSRSGSNTSLFLLAPRAPLRQLTTDPPHHGGPLWMPGEREIAFVTNHGEGPGFWAVDPETGRERMLFLLAELPQPPAGSRDSTAAPFLNIAIARDFTRLAMAVVRDGAPNLWVASLRESRPDGALVQRTFESEGGTYPVWSPDGRWIAYQCASGTDTHVCVTGADDGDRIQLTNEPGQSWIGGWAPDSDRIVFAARRGAVWNVATVSRSTSVVRTLTSFTEPRLYVRYPRWDRAHNRIVFERSETTGRIWSVDLPSPL
jgi:Tol biopolymer transport system component